MTGQVQIPKITAPTGPVSVAKPQGQPYGPTLMNKPVQGYQTPQQTVDYNYYPQSQQGQTIASPQWAKPRYYSQGKSFEQNFPGLRPVYDANGNMIFTSEAPSV